MSTQGSELTIGLLETDILYPDLQADFVSYGHMFADFFSRFERTSGWRFRYYQTCQGELPVSLDECDAWLITGSKSGVYDPEPWIAPLQEWIRSAHRHERKLLGICFGHQILAHTLGGHAGRSPKGWGIGIRNSRVMTLPDWASAAADDYKLIYSHRDQVETLPPDATRLAGCDFCSNAAFYIGDTVLAFQGHPEFTVEYTNRLLPRRQSCIGEPVFSNGMATLDQNQPDGALVGQWMIDFIESGQAR